jgi:transposase-like protein
MVLLRLNGRYTTGLRRVGTGRTLPCIRCGGGRTRRDGRTRLAGQRWRCNDCRRRVTARSGSAFSGRGFADDVIALAVRGYVRYRLSYADRAAWLAERAVDVERSTV